MDERLRPGKGLKYIPDDALVVRERPMLDFQWQDWPWVEEKQCLVEDRIGKMHDRMLDVDADGLYAFAYSPNTSGNYMYQDVSCKFLWAHLKWDDALVADWRRQRWQTDTNAVNFHVPWRWRIPAYVDGSSREWQTASDAIEIKCWSHESTFLPIDKIKIAEILDVS